ncbi:S24 family peptidase [Flavobacterium sedimenticola]|uniref:S24 family peptidase n=1 Tax=Flavobacterium sedimenticola TaxID=3043286 RepID=A0ABT6XMQ3_9FLAO|nr:S24 family peptidase [Flavobacterium sedimenticola]MDI9256362.1 S24 family peptidase [Flavobacterium sedimenticola]
MAESLTSEEIKSIRIRLGMTQTEFGEMLGAKLRTVQSWENGDRNMKEGTVMLLKQKTDAHNAAHSVNDTPDTYNIEVKHLDGLRSSIMHVPMVNQYAYAGYLSGFADNEYVENLPKIPFIVDKEYRGEYLCFEVKGDSMECDTEESIPEGSILLCRNVRKEYWKNKLHIHKWDFVIVHNTDGILVKRIINHNVEAGIITIHSLNEFYPDRELHLKDIQQIFNIVEVQTKRKRR